MRTKHPERRRQFTTFFSTVSLHAFAVAHRAKRGGDCTSCTQPLSAIYASLVLPLSIGTGKPVGGGLFSCCHPSVRIFRSTHLLGNRWIVVMNAKITLKIFFLQFLYIRLLAFRLNQINAESTWGESLRIFCCRLMSLVHLFSPQKLLLLIIHTSDHSFNCQPV